MMTTTQELIPYTEIADESWSRLAAASNDLAHPMRVVTLATLAACGSPDARTISLRGANRGRARLWFHSDRRASKVAQIRERAEVCVVGYDPRDGVQLRLRGRATVHTSDHVAAQHWEQTSMAMRYLYRMAYPPGWPLPVQDPRTELMEAAMRLGANPDGRENFAVIQVTVESIQWWQVQEIEQRTALLRGENDWRVEPLTS